jgi:hypothetical protein
LFDRGKRPGEAAMRAAQIRDPGDCAKARFIPGR